MEVKRNYGIYKNYGTVEVKDLRKCSPPDLYGLKNQKHHHQFISYSKSASSGTFKISNWIVV